MFLDDLDNTGVYSIFCGVTEDRYIGSSARSFRRRWREHRRQLRAGTHHNSHMQRAWNKYGEENFDFCVVEVCEPTKVLEREQYYIDSWNPAYNVCRIAGSPFGIKRSEYTKQKMVLASRIRWKSENVRANHKASLRRYWDGDTSVRRATMQARWSDERRILQSTIVRSAWESGTMRAAVRAHHVNCYILYSPNGILHTFEIIAEFARMHSLAQTAIAKLLRGERESYRGWTRTSDKEGTRQRRMKCYTGPIVELDRSGNGISRPFNIQSRPPIGSVAGGLPTATSRSRL